MTADPFFDEFRRLRPDVPVVLLPADAARAGDADVPPVGADAAAERAAAAREEALAVLEELWPVVGDGRPVPGEVRHSWDGEGPGRVRARVRARSGPEASHADVVASGPDEAAGAVARVAVRLQARGWEVATRPVGGSGTRLTGVRGGEGRPATVEVVGWGPAQPWDVTVASAPVEVGAAVTALRRTSVVLGWGARPGDPR